VCGLPFGADQVGDPPYSTLESLFIYSMVEHLHSPPLKPPQTSYEAPVQKSRPVMPPKLEFHLVRCEVSSGTPSPNPTHG
jgi:hypothetical protein